MKWLCNFFAPPTISISHQLVVSLLRSRLGLDCTILEIYEESVIIASAGHALSDAAASRRHHGILLLLLLLRGTNNQRFDGGVPERLVRKRTQADEETEKFTGSLQRPSIAAPKAGGPSTESKVRWEQVDAMTHSHGCGRHLLKQRIWNAV
jgi:hypothetical protein